MSGRACLVGRVGDGCLAGAPPGHRAMGALPAYLPSKQQAAAAGAAAAVIGTACRVRAVRH